MLHLLAVMLSIATLAVGLPVEQAVIRGESPTTASAFTGMVEGALETRAGRLVRALDRTTPSATAKANFLASGSDVDYAIAASPLTSAERSSVTGGVLQIPIGMMSLSFYFNIPSGPNHLNLTECTIAKLLSGAITSWNTPEIKNINPGLTLIDPNNANVKLFVGSETSEATVAVSNYLRVACPVSWSPTQSMSSAASTSVTSDPVPGMSKTAYSFTYMFSYQGSKSGLSEVAVEVTSNTFMLASENDLAACQASLDARIGTDLSADMASVDAFALSAPAGVYPALLLHWMFVRIDQSATGERGPLLQALSELFMSDDMASLAASYGFIPLGASLRADVISSITAQITLQAGYPTYRLEDAGSFGAAGVGEYSLSGNRVDDFSYQISEIKSRLSALQTSVDTRAPVLLRGSGSSAVSLFLWKLMEDLTDKSSTPVLMSYRATGSGTGESETIGEESKGYAVVTDFGASDVPMTQSNFALLAAEGIQVVHIPILVVPIAIFVNLPATALPPAGIRLSTCVLSDMLQGIITDWSDPAITADNEGVAMPSHPILVTYRASSSGTNAVLSQYFAQSCPSWKLGSGKTLPTDDATGSWPESAFAASSSGSLTDYIQRNQFSIGYADAGNGESQGLTQVALKNKDGVWVKTTTADLSAAATTLFQSNGWPSSPTADFSAVSMLDLAGAATWPISSMPFMMLRTDVTSRGPSGQLLKAFLSFMLSDEGQDKLPALGFGKIPSDVLEYTLTRAVPLLQVDNSYPPWLLEFGKAKTYGGARDFVLSNFRESYLSQQVNHIQSVLASGVLTSGSGGSGGDSGGDSGVNLTDLDLSALSGMAELKQRIADQDDEIEILKTIAAAALAFGIMALVLALCAGCYVFITGGRSGRVGDKSMSGSVSGTRSGAFGATSLKF